MTMKHPRKRRRRIHRRIAPGAAPGQLKVDPEAPKSRMRVMAYGPKEFEERQPDSIEGVEKLRGKYPVLWVHVEGLGSADLLRSLCELFKVHALAMEDVVNVNQRAKVEQYGEQMFIVGRLPVLDDHFSAEQVSVVLGKDFVLTFQETHRDFLEPVRDRIRNARGRIRAVGTDYLAYAVVDVVTDNYFPVLEQFGERLDALEEDVIYRTGPDSSARIYAAKRELMSLRRAVWPMRDALNTLLRDPSSLIRDETRTFFRDCYDHVVQILDHLEMYREMGSGLMDVFLNTTSNKMNEVMKVLTMIATIFIPLSFIAGLYGMNFNTGKSALNMPELNWSFGYPFALVLMLLVSCGMVFYFRKKGWLGFNRAPETRPDQPAVSPPAQPSAPGKEP